LTTQLEHLKQTTDDVREALTRLNQQSSEFCSDNKIICKPGCGACCERPSDVWATVGEMLPMAWDIFARGDHDLVMRQISRDDTDAMCAMFIPAPGQPGNGRCGEYLNRPVTCILFGASANKSKEGLRRLLACGYLREQKSENGHTLREDSMDAGLLAEKVRFVISDNHLKEDQPINKALKDALELIQWAHYAAGQINAQHPSGQDFVR
jgi:Fe-S-cluster containining protein